jgi:hypothetical protein
VNNKDVRLLLNEWLKNTPHSKAAARELLRRAGSRGGAPSRQSFDADDPVTTALCHLLPERYIARQQKGRKLIFALPAFEDAQGWPAGTILLALSELLQLPLENRRQEREERKAFLLRTLEPFVSDTGLAGNVARNEWKEVEGERGRLWLLASESAASAVQLEIHRYMRLLSWMEQHRTTNRVIRAVHVGREVAGDTHWFRPGTRPWQWTAEDLFRYFPGMPEPTSLLQGAEWRQLIFQTCGVVESLSSVRVMVFGNMALYGSDFEWAWPREAARQKQPVWLSIAHLQQAQLRSDSCVQRVVTVENETSFWDLLEREGNNRETILVYTEGQANRAVLLAMRQLAEPGKSLNFQHQGDLDLPGVRIFHSLRQRTGILIEADRMNPQVFLQHLEQGIQLNAKELDELSRELISGVLPLQELLQELHRHRRRLEQEVLTARV